MKSESWDRTSDPLYAEAISCDATMPSRTCSYSCSRVIRSAFQKSSLTCKNLLRILLSVVFVVFVLYTVHQSDFYTVRFKEPILEIKGLARSRCCIKDSSKDVCGRSDCSMCSPQYLHADHMAPQVDGTANNAFFHETSGAAQLDTRQACAIESFALLNPEVTVHLLMTSRNGFVNESASTMKALEGYRNIRVTNIDLSRYFAETPLEHWYFCTTWNYGPHAVSHLSDALRFLTLYKYGGYYFDLDVIQLQPVSHIHRNFVVADVGMKNMAVGALHVDFKHPIIRLAVEEFRNTYWRDNWGYNGPELFQRIMKRWCNVADIPSMTSGKCHGFRVLPPRTFYPISWRKWKEYFKSSPTTPQWNEEVIGLHVWNKKSAEEPVYKSSDQIYAQVAQSQCPQTFKLAPEVF